MTDNQLDLCAAGYDHGKDLVTGANMPNRADFDFSANEWKFYKIGLEDGMKREGFAQTSDEFYSW